MNISIVSGWLPVAIESVAVIVLALAVDWRDGGWRPQLGVGVATAVVASATTGAPQWIGTPHASVVAVVLTTVRPGGHDFDLWSQASSDEFPWISWRLGLTGVPTHEPVVCVTP